MPLELVAEPGAEDANAYPTARGKPRGWSKGMHLVRRVAYSCAGCGVTFSDLASQRKGSLAYCDKACMVKPRVKCECATCGKEILDLKSQRSGSVAYCNQACRSKFMIGKKTWNYGKKVRVARACLACGTLMYGQANLIRRRRFCGTGCSGRYHSGYMAPGWRGGSSTARARVRHTPEHVQWREAVAQRDNGCCRVCMSAGVLTKADLETHHIIPLGARPDLGCEVGNGILLCRSHHLATQGRENEFAEELAALIGVPLMGVPVANQPDRGPWQISDELHRQYVIRERSTLDIAHEHGITPECVQKYLKRFGIRARSPVEAAHVRLSRIS